MAECTEVNICKDHRDKTEVPDSLAVGDLISYKLNDKRKLARLISQYRDIFYNISEGTAFLLQGVTEKHGKRRNMDRVYGKRLYMVFIIWLCLTSLLISARPQRQTNAEGCRNFGDLDQLKSKGTIQKTVDLSPRRREERK